MNSSWTLLCFGLIAFSFVFFQPIPARCVLDQNSSVSTPAQSMLQTPAQEIGDNRSFWALNLDTMERYVVDAYLLAIGNLCYIYFDDLVISIIGEEEANTRAETYREEFDSNIYPRVTDLAGDPDGTLGDVDGDPRFYILIVEHRQSYYLQTNEVAGEHSNLCEMVYICYRTSNPVRTINHEFHHTMSSTTWSGSTTSLTRSISFWREQLSMPPTTQATFQPITGLFGFKTFLMTLMIHSSISRSRPKTMVPAISLHSTWRSDMVCSSYETWCNMKMMEPWGWKQHLMQQAITSHSMNYTWTG